MHILMKFWNNRDKEKILKLKGSDLQPTVLYAVKPSSVREGKKKNILRCVRTIKLYFSAPFIRKPLKDMVHFKKS